MKMMLASGMLYGLTSLEMSQCEDCILGKQTRVSFSKTARTPKKEKLELVHSDVWGPASVPFTWWIEVLCDIYSQLNSEGLGLFYEE